ncbi:polyphosphate polymerase domain-containing protein [Paenibacillus sp. 481]|nr:polyphosphate polymerase domain-containing protein [Paenibacillus sp. 481]
MNFGDVKLRHELKFYIHHHEYIGLRQRIRSLLTLDKHSVDEEGYHIRSLYFDNKYESALHNKNEGIFHRRKYRIRIYNKCDSIIKLERKSKWNELVSKESEQLTRAQVDRIMLGDYEALLDNKDERSLSARFYRDFTQGAMQPAVIVDYVREAYLYDAGDVRITFDKQLSAGVHSLQLFDPHLMTRSMIGGPRTILEVKYNQFMPRVVFDLLQMSAHQRSTISKYAICKESRKPYAY